MTAATANAISITLTVLAVMLTLAALLCAGMAVSTAGWPWEPFRRGRDYAGAHHIVQVGVTLAILSCACGAAALLIHS